MASPIGRKWVAVGDKRGRAHESKQDERVMMKKEGGCEQKNVATEGLIV